MRCGLILQKGGITEPKGERDSGINKLPVILRNRITSTKNCEIEYVK